MNVKGEVLLQLLNKSKLTNETKTFLEPKFFSIDKIKKLGFNAPLTVQFFFQLINSRKKASREYDVILEEGKEAHWEVVERILFIYAKLNPGTGYVQGMNELVGPLYYTLASDPNKEWRGTQLCFCGIIESFSCSFYEEKSRICCP